MRSESHRIKVSERPSSATRLYRGRLSRLTFDIKHAATLKQSGETMTRVSAGHIIILLPRPKQ